MSGWRLWKEEKATDPTKLYRWRVSKRLILGMELQPEWGDKLSLILGMGCNEYWPPYSDWNGYKRTLDKTLEWREALPGELGIQWNGLELLPSPFTGKQPNIIYSGRWVTAPPYQPEWLGIRSYLVESLGWTIAADMQRTWNTRACFDGIRWNTLEELGYSYKVSIDNKLT